MIKLSNHRILELCPTDMKKDINKYHQARLLRKAGHSIRDIANQLKISSSTSSIWCKDIALSSKQRVKLDYKPEVINRLRFYAEKRHNDKLTRNKVIFNLAQGSINKLRKNEFFLIGLALYWAEGFKNISEHRVGFCNSDPRMIRFMMSWFRNSLNIPEENFTLRAEFNFEHASRQIEIENYWSELTGIPLSQFNKPYLQKAKLLRDYPHRGKYFGVLRIRIRKSSVLLEKIRGWIEGLSTAFPKVST